MLNSSSSKSQKLTQIAVKWFLRMRNTDVDHPDRGRFEAWLMSNPIHAEEFSSVSEVWEDFDNKENLQILANAVAQKQFAEKTADLKSKKRIAHHAIRVLFIGVISLIGFKGYDHWQMTPNFQLAEVTKVGQQLSRTLDDGSSLYINGNSEVKVTYYRNRRIVKLSKGEVIFDVSKDPDRPFIVDSGYAKVTVLGTRFAVNRIDKLVRVSVDHGRVQVEALPLSKSNPPLVLISGQVAEVKENGVTAKVYRNASDAFNFRQGKLNFENSGLDEIAEIISRYRKPAVVAKLLPKDNPQITAVVKINDIEQFLIDLPQVTSVEVKSTQQQTLLITKTSKN